MQIHKDVDFLIDDLRGAIWDYNKMSSEKILFPKFINLKHLVEKAVTILVSLNNIELNPGNYTIIFTQERIEQEEVILVNFYLCSTELSVSSISDVLLMTYSIILRDNSRKLIYENRSVERALINELGPEEMELLFDILMSSSEMSERVNFDYPFDEDKKSYGIKKASPIVRSTLSSVLSNKVNFIETILGRELLEPSQNFSEWAQLDDSIHKQALPYWYEFNDSETD